ESPPHAHDLMRCQCARSHAALMPTAVHLCRDPDLWRSPDVKRPHTFRAINLVSREREQIHLKICNIHWQLAGGLGSINMKQHATCSQALANGTDIGQRPELIIDHHHADQHRVIPKRGLDRLNGYPTISAWLQPGNLNALLLQPLAGINDRLV